MKNQQMLLRIITLMILLYSIRAGAQQEVKFMTFNIWQEGTSVENGLTKIRDVIIETNADIICFTEVRNYNNEDWTTKIVDQLETQGYYYNRGYVGGDVSIISKFPIISSSLIYEGAGSVAKFDIELTEQNIVVACAHLDYTFYACYLPRGYNGGSPNWGIIDDGNGLPDPVTDTNDILNYNLLSSRDEQMMSFINSTINELNPIIFMGDFNEPSHLDWTENTKTMFDHNNVVIDWQNTQFLTENGFHDAFRVYFPDEVNNPGMTWPSYAHGVGSTSWTPLADERDRIDYIFYKGQGIVPTFMSLVGPKESYVHNQIDTLNTANENFLASDLEWPSDHKAVFATLQFQNSTSISEQNAEAVFSISPNPSKDILSIYLDKQYNNIFIEILNIEGQKLQKEKVENSNVINLDVANLADGVYLIQVNTGDIRKTIKFVKQ